MVYALSRLLDTYESIGLPNQTINVYIIYNTTYMGQGSTRLFTIRQFSNNFIITQK